MSAPLVIITRPHEAGAPLAAALRTAGFAPFEWPLLALEPEPEALDRLPATLPGADWLVVVSPSAARLIAPALARLPAGLRLAAVGRATAQVLEQASGRPVPYEIVARRPGDVAQCYAEPTLAEQELGWRATRGIDEMCADSWRWQSTNPQGYPD